MQSVTASIIYIYIIQSCAIGPASYIINAVALSIVFVRNLIVTYADDTIPASNIQSRAAELQNVEEWSRINNLKLN